MEIKSLDNLNATCELQRVWDRHFRSCCEMGALPKTLPASWYRSAPLYQLERRAIFVKVQIHNLPFRNNR